MNLEQNFEPTKKPSNKLFDENSTTNKLRSKFGARFVVGKNLVQVT